MEVSISLLVLIPIVFFAIIGIYYSVKNVVSQDIKSDKQSSTDQRIVESNDSEKRDKLIETTEMQRKKTQKYILDKFLQEHPEDAARILRNWLIKNQTDSNKA